MMRLKILLKMILKNSKLAQTWLIGKVEFVISSKGGDKNCWNINVLDGERRFSIVKRPVRECIKLDFEDTSLLDDIKTVQKISQ